MEKVKRNHEIAFLAFMVLVAALGNQNPSFQYPQILWSFLGLLVFNLANLALWDKFLPPKRSALISIAANNLLIASIIHSSGGRDSYFWVLFLLPIFTACLFLTRRGALGAAWLEAAMLGLLYLPGLAWEGAVPAFLEWAVKSATLLICGLVTLKAVHGEREARRALEEEQAKAEAEKREMSQRLAHADRLATVGTLVASLAHEISNPLTAILGIAEIHKSGVGRPEDMRKDLEVVGGAAQRCRQVLQDLLAFSRKKTPEPEPCDVNGLLRQCLALKKYDWVHHKIAVTEDYAEGLPRLKLVATQFQQVVYNLLINSQQAMASAKKGGRIWVRTQQVGECARISIEDDGPGISAELLGRIFEPFFTTKPMGIGTGLGLSISKQLVEGMGGSLAARSTLGRGASFTIEIPLQAQAPEPKEAEARAAKGQPRVLVAEDEAIIIDVLRRALSPMGLEVRAVNSFNEALLAIRQDPPDLYLTDLKMPGMSAHDFFRILESEGRLGRLPVIAISGSMAGTGFEELLREKNIPYVAKPFVISELTSAVRRAFGKRLANGENHAELGALQGSVAV